MVDIPRLSDEIRASLPPEVQAYITTLETVIPELQGQVEVLQAQVSELQARTRQNSRNSSRPPSSDPPDAPPRPKRKPSPRKRGGQPGHQRHERQLLCAEAVDEVVDHHPEECPLCHKQLAATLPDVAEPERHQVWDIPPVQPYVTEHRYHQVECPDCHTTVQAERPAEVPLGAFGASVIALIGLLRGQYRLSIRKIVALLLDIFHLPISTGGVVDLCHLLSAALAKTYTESQDQVSEAERANVDETGWKKAGKKLWLWVAVTAHTTLFMIADRSAASLKTLLGESFPGIITSDRFKSYLALAVDRRQACWAHLKRNWQAFSERDGPVGEWAKQAIAQIDKLFDLWHQFKAGQLDRATLQVKMEPVQTELRRLLEEGQGLPLEKAHTFCRNVLALWPALWKFLLVEGVEPTNNAAERALRHAVLWRKICFGTQSDIGAQFVVRILTTVETCRQQKLHTLTFLTHAVQAYISDRPAPAIFPAP
jgi:transposase